MRLGSAFQSKFSKRLEEDNLVLNRNYFPGVDLNSFDEAKNSIIKEIEEDFRVAYEGIVSCPSKQFGFIPPMSTIKIIK
jgi:hypothetical protein